MNLSKTATAWIVWLCAGCDPDGNNLTESSDAQSAVLHGRIVAPIVAGLRFQSGTQSGVTDANGYFTYEPGTAIHFTSAGVELPPLTIWPNDASPEIAPTRESNGGVALTSLSIHELKVAPVVVTPANLSNDSAVVTNIVRLFLMLDADGNPDNGVTISDALQNAPATSIDLSAPDLETAAMELRSAAISLDGVPHSWTAVPAAVAYLKARRSCAFTGIYAGAITSGVVSGSITAIVSPPQSEMVGIIQTGFGEPYHNGLFHFSFSTGLDFVANTTGDTEAVLHEYSRDWPTAPVIASAPAAELMFDWIGNYLGGALLLDELDGVFDAQQVANMRSPDTEFAAARRFVRFPTRWQHAKGHSMYEALIVEIANTGAVSARLVDPITGTEFVRMDGNVSGTATVRATSKTALGQDDWIFHATLDSVGAELRDATLYQWQGSVLADDFQDGPIRGCSL